MYRPHPLPRAVALGAAALLVLSAAAGCAHAPASGGHVAASPHPVLYRDARSIAFAEIATSRSTTAYDAVRALRPEFLRRRYPSPLSPDGQLPTVYVDDHFEGDVGALRMLPASAVARIRLLTPVEAGHRFGIAHDHRGGVILVQMRRM